MTHLQVQLSFFFPVFFNFPNLQVAKIRPCVTLLQLLARRHVDVVVASLHLSARNKPRCWLSRLEGQGDRSRELMGNVEC